MYRQAIRDRDPRNAKRNLRDLQKSNLLKDGWRPSQKTLLHPFRIKKKHLRQPFAPYPCSRRFQKFFVRMCPPSWRAAKTGGSSRRVIYLLCRGLYVGDTINRSPHFGVFGVAENEENLKKWTKFVLNEFRKIPKKYTKHLLSKESLSRRVNLLIQKQGAKIRYWIFIFSFR